MRQRTPRTLCSKNHRWALSNAEKVAFRRLGNDGMPLIFYQQFLQVLRETTVVLAVVTQVRGSVPREVGAKMLIWGEQSTFDTIGGGAGEAKVIHEAIAVLQTGEPRFVEIDLSGAPNRDIQGVCGGWMQVWLSRWQGEDAIALIQNMLQTLQIGQPVTLALPLNAQQRPFLPAELPPTLAASEKSAIAPQQPFTFPQHPPTSVGVANLSNHFLNERERHTPHTSHSKDHSWIKQYPKCLDIAGLDLVEGWYVETVQPPPTLLIVGAGHVGVALAKVAALTGFAIAVQDDRPQFACAERFPQGSRIFSGAIAQTVEYFINVAQIYIALVTRGFQQDLETLEGLWRKRDRIQPQYLGMIGSQKRVQIVFQELQKRGVDQDWLSQIYAPIGISIGALTPEEIAVSICAELIKVRRNGKTKHGRAKD